jgi:acetylornithine deacetylase/succinyl-diaminopimelate desuccinylase-like protein
VAACRAPIVTTASLPALISSMRWMSSGANGTPQAETWPTRSENFTPTHSIALTKISGEASFSLDVRSLDAQSLAQLEERVHAIANAIAARRGDPDGRGSTGTPCGERETGGQHKFPNSHMTLA